MQMIFPLFDDIMKKLKIGKNIINYQMGVTFPPVIQKCIPNLPTSQGYTFQISRPNFAILLTLGWSYKKMFYNENCD